MIIKPDNAVDCFVEIAIVALGFLTTTPCDASKRPLIYGDTNLKSSLLKGVARHSTGAR
jgi:hypothetical protein